MSDQARASEACRVRPVAAALVAVLIGAAAALSVSARADEVFASVGTGEPNGVYYPVGKAICQIANRDFSMYRVRCSPETTLGSVYNIGGASVRRTRVRDRPVRCSLRRLQRRRHVERTTVPWFALGDVPLSRARYRHGSRRFAYSGSCRPGGQTDQYRQPGHRHLNNLGCPRSGTRLARPGAGAAGGAEGRRDDIRALQPDYRRQPADRRASIADGQRPAGRLPCQLRRDDRPGDREAVARKSVLYINTKPSLARYMGSSAKSRPSAAAQAW